jgi:hypothetical protein
VTRKWQQATAAAALSLALAAPLTGCAGRPAPRPEATAPSPAGGIDRSRSDAVTTTAAAVWGGGTVAAVVKGNVALVAMQLNSTQPGGTEGGPLTGKTHSVDYPGSSAGGGPLYVQGPGGSVGTSPSMPGGQLSAGGTSPGGTPNYTQAAPNGFGMQATQNATNAPAPNPGQLGSAPMDVMTRMADQVRTRHPDIVEVRFATAPAEATRVAEIARDMRNGKDPGAYNAEVETLYAQGVPAGTYEFDPNTPSQGTRPSGQP